MRYQAQKMSVVAPGVYALYFHDELRSPIQVDCFIAYDDDGIQLLFKETGIPQPLLQMLSTSAAWKQAIQSFHRVASISYAIIFGEDIPSWGPIPIHLHAIEMESDVTCKLQFMEPDGSMKAIQVEMQVEDERIRGFMMDGDTTVTNRIFAPRDMYQVTKDFLDAVQELERLAA